MAAPNIVNVSTIIGISTFLQPSTISPTVILSNAAASNKVFKVNNITASNEIGSLINVSVRLCNGVAGTGSSVSLGSTMTVPAGSSVVLVGKDNPFYLEEARSITVSCATTSGASFLVSYEDIS